MCWQTCFPSIRQGAFRWPDHLLEFMKRNKQQCLGQFRFDGFTDVIFFSYSSSFPYEGLGVALKLPRVQLPEHFFLRTRYESYVHVPNEFHWGGFQKSRLRQFLMLLFSEVKARQLCLLGAFFFNRHCRTAASLLSCSWFGEWGSLSCWASKKGEEHRCVDLNLDEFFPNQSFLEEFHSIGTLDAAWPLTRSVQFSLTGFSCNHGPKNHGVSLKEKPVNSNGQYTNQK